MAIIGSIQEKGRYFLVGFVGLALLTFILTGLFDVIGTSGKAPNLGTIDGEDVDPRLFESNLLRFRSAAEQQAAMQNQQMTEQQYEQAEENAWLQTVDDIVLGNEFKALGIDEITDVELDAYLYGREGFPLLQEIAQGFTDSITGAFDAKKLERFINERETAKDPKAVADWQNTKDALRRQRQQEKYFQLISQGAYATQLEAKDAYLAQKEVKSVSLVARFYREIQDEDIKITDADVKKFWEEHKNEKKYEQLAGRDVKYFDITVQPSKKDSADFRKVMQELKKNFQASKTAKDDSLFALTNAETKGQFKRYANPYRAANDPNAKGLVYPESMDSVFKRASVGQVVGPYQDAQNPAKQILAKIAGYNTQSLSARHILLAANRKDAKASAPVKKMADSLAAIIKGDTSKFVGYVAQYSGDSGSKDKGGKYDDFAKDEFVPEFSEFVINNPVGTVGVVQSDFGFHIIQVLGKKDARIPLLSLVDRTLAPSSETESSLKDKAYNVLITLDRALSKEEDVFKKLNLFDTIVRKEGFFVRPLRIMDEAPRVSGFTSKLAAKKIMELAYQEGAEVGKLCDAPINDEGRYVIAMVSSIRTEDGAPTFEDSYQQMRVEAIKEKKANKFKAQIGAVRNLKTLSKKFNAEIINAEITFGNPSIQGGGYEPEIVGALFSGLKDGQTTIPLVGNAGVYVVRLNKTIKAPAAANYTAEQTQILAQIKGNFQNEAKRALQKRLKVYDNRKLQEVGIAR